MELTFVPFREDIETFSGSLHRRAEDVEGKHHSNPYALILLRGENKKTEEIFSKKIHFPPN
ncbi:hypothetical protein RJ639_015600 [Escallonia herrerae]|uniref:Uncharacterized protein n=1 Tax=Escallonia herrerae TaxID=1293975 RepID=A0AA89ALM8_9ASTE|nr:hypothetical protein RJ639_015600 [Escallonia herrerae]